jgi:hypothetical protein
MVTVVIAVMFFFLPIARQPGTVTSGSVCEGSSDDMVCHKVTGAFISASYLTFCFGARILWPPVDIRDYQPLMFCMMPEL